MRIIAGRFKGLRLPSPKKKGVRPTTDRVREALFSTLGPDVTDSRVLDLFAGTGAFGFEALSRGAASVVFVDSDRQVARTLSRTCHGLGVVDQVRILTMSAEQAVKRLSGSEERFEIIFLDPPYGEQLIPEMVYNPIFASLFERNGLLIVEREERASELAVPTRFEKEFNRKYGSTIIEIFRYNMSDVSTFPLR